MLAEPAFSTLRDEERNDFITCSPERKNTDFQVSVTVFLLRYSFLNLKYTFICIESKFEVYLDQKIEFKYRLNIPS